MYRIGGSQRNPGVSSDGGNLGIASVVRNFAEEHLTEGDLFELRFLEEIPARTFCIVANERIPLSAAAATLMNVLVQGTSQ